VDRPDRYHKCKAESKDYNSNREIRDAERCEEKMKNG